MGVAVYFFTKPTPPPKPIAREELIAIDSYSIGNASASAYLVEFSDFQCPACRAFMPVVDELATKVFRQIILCLPALSAPATYICQTRGYGSRSGGRTREVLGNGKAHF